MKSELKVEVPERRIRSPSQVDKTICNEQKEKFTSINRKKNSL